MDFLTSNDWVLPLRTSTLTAFFRLMPMFVGEMFYLTIVFLGYWVINKAFFRYLGCCVCAFTLLNNVLKVFFAIPRPKIERLVALKDPFGFPSGDVQVATIFWGMLCLKFPLKSLRVLGITILASIGFSRIYLGAHTLLDVMGGFFMGIICCFCAWKFYRKEIKLKPLTQLVIALGLIIFSFMYLNKVHYLYSYVLLSGGLWLSAVLSLMLHQKYNSSVVLTFHMAVVAYVTTIFVRLMLSKICKNNFFMAFCLGFYALWLFEFLICKIKFKTLEKS